MHRRSLIILISLFFIPVISHAQSPAENFAINPCTAFGPLTAKTTYNDLVQIYGKDNVQDAQLQGPEGEITPSTIVFPKDPNKKMEIIWKDKNTKSGLDMVEITGTRSVWKTSQGFSLGTTLKEMEKINGAPFKIYGFEWDFGGRVAGWGTGTLSKIPKGFNVSFDYRSTSVLSEQEKTAIAGDKEIPSTSPILQKANPTIAEIQCFFQQGSNKN